MNRIQQCFAIKPSADPMLELARASFCRTTELIHELAARYAKGPCRRSAPAEHYVGGACRGLAKGCSPCSCRQAAPGVMWVGGCFACSSPASSLPWLLHQSATPQHLCTCRYQQQHNASLSLKACYSAKRGFYLAVTRGGAASRGSRGPGSGSGAEQLPSGLILLEQRPKGICWCTSHELNALNSRLSHAAASCLQLTEEVWREARELLPCWAATVYSAQWPSHQSEAQTLFQCATDSLGAHSRLLLPRRH